MKKYVIGAAADGTWRNKFKEYLDAKEISYYFCKIDEFKENLDQGEKPLVICSGGDGSLNRACKYLLKNDLNDKVAISYFPSGTGNDFARGTGLYDLELEEVLDMAFSIEPTEVSCGQIDKRYFVNMASCGQFSTVTPNVDRGSKDLFGQWSYYVEGLSVLKELQPQSIRFCWDNEEEVEYPVYGFFLGNSKYCGGGVKVTGKADVSSEELDLLIIKEMPISKLIQLGLALQMETADLSDYEVVYKKIKKLKFSSDKLISMSLDGEPYQMKNSQVATLPKALRIYLPKN